MLESACDIEPLIALG